MSELLFLDGGKGWGLELEGLYLQPYFSHHPTTMVSGSLPRTDRETDEEALADILVSKAEPKPG